MPRFAGGYNRFRRLSVDERFNAKVDRRGPCWLWTGAKGMHGYGQFRPDRDGPLIGAHRWAWERENGAIPHGLVVRHDCDTPACVRPSHLRLGTRRDNTQDAKARGRLAVGARHGSRTTPGPWGAQRRENLAAMSANRPRGERVGSARLSDDAVREIRRRVARGELRVTVATTYGVAPSTVSRIVSRKAWGHVA